MIVNALLRMLSELLCNVSGGSFVRFYYALILIVEADGMINKSVNLLLISHVYECSFCSFLSGPCFFLWPVCNLLAS